MFIDPELTKPILDWTLNSDIREKYFTVPKVRLKGNVCGMSKTEMYDKKIHQAGFPYVQMFKIHQSILKHYNLPNDFPLDHYFGALISYSEAEHEVQPHTDPNDGKNIHTRFNVLISKPEVGGLGVINEQVIEVEENEVWVCAAGRYLHYSTKVEGPKPRILLSFGHFIHPELLETILN